MRWDERQRAMLREIGVHSWWPVDDEVATVAEQPACEAAVAPQAAAVATPTATPASRVQAPPPSPIVARQPPSREADPARAPLELGHLGWPELRAAVAACTACGLAASRSQTVFGVGHERAHWMIVGEAPGEPDDREGEPFLGKPGQLLDNMLRAIGLTRGEAEPARQVFIANALKCRTPGSRNPAADELAQCASFLARQVQLVQPRILIAMGAAAAQSLLGSTEPLGRLRGRVHRYRGVPLIVTFPPAYLLRNPVDKAKAWDDLCLAVETAAAANDARAPTSAA